MNIIGKILVILNLVFALVTGGFLVIDYVTRSNWKKYAEGLERELTVVKASSEVMAKTTQDLNKQVDKAKKELITEQEARKGEEIVKKIEIDDYKRKAEEAGMDAKKHDLVSQQALGEAGRLKKENEDLLEVIKKRDKTNLEMQQQNNELRATNIANENLAKATIVRNQNLLDQLMEARRKLAELEAGSTSAASAVDPNRPNPPGVYVKGRVEKVDVKDGLVEVDLGSDQGLKLNNTLEVFRLSPKAEYLGMIRIVDVKHHRSVGRVVRNAFTTIRGQIRQGDQVASSLSRP